MPPKRIIAWLFCAVVSLLFARGVHAEGSARHVIEQTINDALTVLRNPTLKADHDGRLRKLRDVADRTFDWPVMAQSSLGAPWRQITPAQRREFVEVFKELLAQRYMNDLDRFQGSEVLTVGSAEQRGDLTIVKTTLLTASREQIPIDYTLHLDAGAWRAEDVSIEGVSLVNHYRKTFARFLANRSFGDLLQQLKAKLGPGGSTPAPT
jgi:phospholipid transport system substrate-binding protein